MVRKIPLIDESSTTTPFHRRLIKKGLGSIRNALGISCFVGILSGSICLFRHALGRESLLQYGLGGLCAAPTIFLDQPGRLVELNAYSASKVLESWVLSLQLLGWVKYNR